jgi:hypothetical protein
MSVAAARCRPIETCFRRGSSPTILGAPRRAASSFLEQHVLGGHAPRGQGPFHDQQQVVGIDRLGEKIERAFLHRGDRVGNIREGGHQDDRQLRVDLLGGAQHAEAVAVGQPQIGQDDCRVVVCSAAAASAQSRASTTTWPCASSARRSIVRSESLSSTSRIGEAAGGRDRTVNAASREEPTRAVLLPEDRRSLSRR